MKKITKNEVLNNEFAKTNGGVITVKHPSKAQAEEMSYRDLCIVLCGSEALKFRPVDKAVENANSWLQKNNREELMRLLY